jgi:ligand-binding SRPBCC domain-containing protein
VTDGLIGLGEEVEWSARHFGLWLSMRVKIMAFNRPIYFQDAMVKGPFHHFRHDHTFEDQRNSTLMIDRIAFASPVPFIGSIVDLLVLKTHLRRFLEQRNRMLKLVAESEKWHKYLSFPKS